ncbi:MAG: tetratricopeptide repeat protein, partial [Cyclobacteriaceae bacterium]
MNVNMRFVLQVIFLYSIFPLSAQTTNSSQLDFEKAVGIHNKGEYKEALKQFDKLFFAGFSDPDIFRYRGFAKFKLNDFQGAAEDLDKVRADQDPQVLGVLGICKYELGELEAAKFFLINATKAGFDNGKGHLYLGYLYLDGHQYVEALEQLNKAENAGEKEMKLYEARGFAAFYASNLDLAISDLERVVKSGNDSLTFYEVLGLAYAGKNLFDKALPFLEKSDSLKSANSSVYFQLGNAYLERKLFTSAIEGYTKAISLNYNLPDVYLNRGKAKLAAGLTKESIADFDYLLKVNAEDIAAYRGRIEANLRLKDWPRIVTD